MTQTPTDKLRLNAERQFVARYVRAAIQLGYSLSVFDGEEVTLRRSTDAAAILDAMFTVDHETLHVYAGSKRLGWLFFVHGNEPEEVLNDYTASLEHVVTAAENGAR
jgi:hypothetical protein